jgi:hypothetical protein
MANGNGNGLKSKTIAFMQVAQVLAALSLPVLGWGATKVIDHEKEIAVINSNRFTANDGQEIWKELYVLREQVGLVSGSLQENVYRRLDKIETLLSEIQTHLVKDQ